MGTRGGRRIKTFAPLFAVTAVTHTSLFAFACWYSINVPLLLKIPTASLWVLCSQRCSGTYPAPTHPSDGPTCDAFFELVLVTANVDLIKALVGAGSKTAARWRETDGRTRFDAVAQRGVQQCY